MDTHAPTHDSRVRERGSAAGSRRLRRAFAVLVAAAVAWLIFAAYRQPGFILDVAALRLC